MAGEAYVGGEAKLYYNAGTYGSPTWTLIGNVQDLDLPDSRGVAEAPIRTQWPIVGKLGGGRNISLSWTSICIQETTDTALTAMIAAYEAGTLTEFAIADQAIATTGCKYRRMITFLSKMDESQPLNGVCTLSFEAHVTVNTGGNAPSRTTV